MNKMKSIKVKLFKPFVSWWSVFYTLRTLRSGQLAEGPMVKLLEKKFLEKFKLPNVLALNSGTSALELAYEIADIGDGDEVITPVLTCTATNIPLVRRKAKIVFADTDYDLNIDVEDVKRKITSNTKAIVFVHFGGNNRGLEELLKLAESKKIVLIEDAAQAVGSDFWGKADFTCVSTQAIKTFTTGDGGFLICRDDTDHAKGRRLRWFGYDRELKQKLGDTDLKEPGYKYHMNDISASIGLGNLKSLDRIIEHRKTLITAYKKIGAITGIWFASVLVNKRQEVVDVLKRNGIESGLHHYRNDQYTIFGGRLKSLKKMDELENNYLLLPMHHRVSVRDVEFIGELIKPYLIKNEIYKN
jgi:dTDP-4-amino-4,6-dideoxygalactose transaminase